MPNWSDENGNCHFTGEDGIPCYRGGTGCVMHSGAAAARRVSKKKVVAKKRLALELDGVVNLVELEGNKVVKTYSLDSEEVLKAIKAVLLRE